MSTLFDHTVASSTYSPPSSPLRCIATLHCSKQYCRLLSESFYRIPVAFNFTGSTHKYFFVSELNCLMRTERRDFVLRLKSLDRQSVVGIIFEHTISKVTGKIVNLTTMTNNFIKRLSSARSVCQGRSHLGLLFLTSQIFKTTQ